MRRTLVLDEDDLIMVVKEDIVKKIDENRGEMNRTEFVNYLIQCQLKDQANQKDCITRVEYQQFARQTTEVLRNFLEFFISYGMAMGQEHKNSDIQSLNDQLDLLHPYDHDIPGL
jgi:hypothetical protein